MRKLRPYVCTAPDVESISLSWSPASTIFRELMAVLSTVNQELRKKREEEKERERADEERYRQHLGTLRRGWFIIYMRGM